MLRRPDDLRPLLDALQSVYDEVDTAMTLTSCADSTECCHFGVTRREPYVTSIELAAVQRAVNARGGFGAIQSPKKADPNRRKLLPLLNESSDETGRCRLLDASGRCGIYASRPLGCRTFFCDRVTGEPPMRQREINQFVRRIQAIAVRHQPDGDRGRPLTRALDAKSR